MRLWFFVDYDFFCVWVGLGGFSWCWFWLKRLLLLFNWVVCVFFVWCWLWGVVDWFFGIFGLFEWDCRECFVYCVWWVVCWSDVLVCVCVWWLCWFWCGWGMVIVFCGFVFCWLSVVFWVGWCWWWWFCCVLVVWGGCGMSVCGWWIRGVGCGWRVCCFGVGWSCKLGCWRWVWFVFVGVVGWCCLI